MHHVKSGGNFADIVYNIIVEDIVNQNLKAGSKLNDKELSAKLGFSRTPVREAIIMLEHDGFVKTVGRDGTYVREFTNEDIREIYIVREALEVMSAKLGAKAINDDNLSLLANIVIQMEKVVNEKKFEEYIQLDYEFHNLIVHSCNVKLLCDICNNLRLLGESIRVRGEHYTENMIKYNKEHRLIYEAFAQHDGDLAEVLLHNHIQNGKMELLLNNN